MANASATHVSLDGRQHLVFQSDGAESATVLLTGAAGIAYVLYQIVVSNPLAVVNTVLVLEETSGTKLIDGELAASGQLVATWPGGLVMTVNKDLTVTTDDDSNVQVTFKRISDTVI